MQNFTRRLLMIRNSLLLILTVSFCLNLMAQKPMAKRAFEITLEADEKITTEIKENMRVNLETGVPVSLYGMNYEVPQGSPESMALYYLEHEAKRFGIPSEEIRNLHHHATRTTNAGSVVRYRQYSGIYPVNTNEITISISPQNKVVYVMNTYRTIPNMEAVQANVSEDDAFQLALDYLDVQSEVLFKDNRLMVYANNKMTRLAHEVTILTNSPAGEWHVFVDAQTREIFKVVDLNHYYHEKDCKHEENCEHKKESTEAETPYFRRVDGTGFIFDPDPLSSNQVAYGGQYVDGNDATNASLDAARFSVTLRDITEAGGVYSLIGPRAEIVDFAGPFDGLWTQNSPDFSYNRSDQAFEAVNVYYHIDFLMDYINNTLGCNVLPYQYATGVRFDPHGFDGADNSSYSTGSGQLQFGEGCVDDAEDSDVIHHELGHGLHDWVTSGGLSQVDGLSEGSGDYIAQSYNRSLGNWGPGDAAYNFMFNWDGHNPCWNGRVTNYGATYPGGLVGQIHTDGQIWASCLMTVWDAIGQQEMDKIFYEGMGMTNGGSSQNDAANAVYQAAINLGYTEGQLTLIHTNLSACGYTLPPLAGPPVAAFSADNNTICLDDTNMVTFTDESVSSPAATGWAWTFEGGTPGTSGDQNPVVTYAAEGTYDVTLMVTNPDGNDTLVETDYITVTAGANCPACDTQASAQNLGLAIPDGPAANTAGTPLTHTITVPPANNRNIDSMILNIDLDHTFIGDLVMELIHPNGTTAVIVWDRDCGTEANLDVNFIDGSPAIFCDEPTIGDYNPVNPLSAFNGLESAGDWTISIVDWWVADTGSLNDWSIEICGMSLSVAENDFDTFSMYPNPNNGEFTISLNSTSNQDITVDVYDIRGRAIINNSFDNTSSFSQVITLPNVQAGMYMVKVSDGIKETIRKIIVE